MCLAVPAQLVTMEGARGVADMHGSRVEISTLLVPEARVGDWVLMHAGFAIQRLEPDAAERTWAVLDDLQRRTQPDEEATP